MKYKLKLYDVFQNEKNRYPDMTIFYNDKASEIQYSNSEGTLTVKFGRDENNKNMEQIYFRKAGETGKGEFCSELKGNGTIQMFEDALCMLPEKHYNIAESYRAENLSKNNEREAIGIDKAQAQAKKKILDFGR